MKKKALTVILSLSMAVALAACGKSTLQARSSQPETKRAQETLEPESLQQIAGTGYYLHKYGWGGIGTFME